MPSRSPRCCCGNRLSDETVDDLTCRRPCVTVAEQHGLVLFHLQPTVVMVALVGQQLGPQAQ